MIKCLTQLRIIVLRLYNWLYNVIPFFFIKKIILNIGGCQIGKKSYIHSPVRMFCVGRIIVGSNSTINFGSFIDARKGVIIGDNVMVAHNVKIYTLGHDYNCPDFSLKGAKVKIENNVCIFSNVMIMPGVVIAEGGVVLPGAIVTKNVEAFTVVGGVPAKKISNRNKRIDYKIEYGYWGAN